MSSAIDSLLTELASAIENGAFDDAESIAIELQETYENRRAEERERVERSRALYARPNSVSLESVGQLAGIGREDGSTRMMRSLLLITVGALVDSPGELEEAGELEQLKQTAEAAIGELQTAEAELADTAETVDTVIAQSEVPPSLSIRSISIPGDTVRPQTTVPLWIDITNTGEQPASGVSVAIRPTADVTAAEETVSVGTVGPDESVTRQTSVSSDTPGSHVITVLARGDNANEDQSTVLLTVTEDADDPDGDDGSEDGSGTGGDDSTEPSDTSDDGSTRDDGVALSPELLAGLGIGSLGMLYLASRMLADGDSDDQPPKPPNP